MTSPNAATSVATAIAGRKPSTPVHDPAALADRLMLVMEGVYASTQALGAGGPAREARALAESMLDAQRR